MEDLIDKAQRAKDTTQTTAEAKAELDRLTRLRDQTYADLKIFVRDREKHHWREWDKLKDTDRKYAQYLEEVTGQADSHYKD